MPRTISGYHPYSVNETNIEETKELFNYDDVQIGDNVEEWDMEVGVPLLVELVFL